MESTNATPSPDSGCHILATDLDGTLVPRDGDPQNLADLKTLAGELEREGTTLIFSTGRHVASVAEAIGRFQLPQPDWLICDVTLAGFGNVPPPQQSATESSSENQDPKAANAESEKDRSHTYITCRATFTTFENGRQKRDHRQSVPHGPRDRASLGCRREHHHLCPTWQPVQSCGIQRLDTTTSLQGTPRGATPVSLMFSQFPINRPFDEQVTAATYLP